MGKQIWSSYFSQALFLLVSFGMLFFSCKKEDHSQHTHSNNPPPVPYRPFAVYVADEGDKTISVIDPLQNKKIGCIDICDHDDPSAMGMPHNVQVAPDGKTVWVTANSHSVGLQDQVIIIFPEADHSIIKRIEAGSFQHLAHVVLDSASNYAYVTATESNQVIKIDAKNFTELKRFNLGMGHGPHGLRYSRGKLYIANMYSTSLSIIDIASEEITEIPLGGTAIQTAVTPDGKYIFASLYYLREIARYDLENFELKKIALPPGSLGPIQIYPTPDNKTLYVCDQGMLGGMPVSDKVYTIDINSFAVTSTITVEQAPHGVVVSSDGNTAYVSNYKSNSISVIDQATKSVICTIPVGKAPNGISYRSPSGGMP